MKKIKLTIDEQDFYFIEQEAEKIIMYLSNKLNKGGDSYVCLSGFTSDFSDDEKNKNYTCNY